MNPETRLIQRVDKRIPKSIHRQSMTGSAMFSNGVPDRYYDGRKYDLWVEYKMMTSMPRSGIVGGICGMKKRENGKYTTLQYGWMERRFYASQPRPNVLGMIGLPDGRIVVQTCPDQWERGTSVDTGISIEEAAQCIIGHCGL